jgi:hypothetical protein
MFSAAMDSDFANSGTDRRHRLAVGWVESRLHQVELITGFVFSPPRENSGYPLLTIPATATPSTSSQDYTSISISDRGRTTVRPGAVTEISFRKKSATLAPAPLISKSVQVEMSTGSNSRTFRAFGKGNSTGSNVAETYQFRALKMLSNADSLARSILTCHRGEHRPTDSL